MTGWPVRARSRRAGALLGAAAILVAGCTAAGGSARHSVAASRPGHVGAHPIAGTPGPGRIARGSRPGMAGASSLAQCAPPLGDPVAGRAGAAPRLRVAEPGYLCCRWCACARACCGCGPARWPPWWWPRPRPAWPCCPRWLGPPDGDGSPIWRGCGPGCGPGTCPVGPARPAAGAVQARSSGLP